METDSNRGPEHVPLPSAARRGARSEPAREPRRPFPDADPSLGKILAVAGGTVVAGILAVAVAGGALRNFAAGLAPAPAAPAAIAASADARPETIEEPSSFIENRPAAPPTARAGAPAAPPASFPEPPTLDAPPAETASAVPAEAARLSPGAASALFGRSAGAFTQWKNDHHSSPVTVSAGAAGGAPNASNISVTSARKSPAPQPRTPSISELRAAAWISPEHASIDQLRAASWISPDHASIAQARAASWISPDAPLPPPKKFEASGDCPDCGRAIGSGGTHAPPMNGLNGPSVGDLQYEGRCKNGYIYRFTRSSGSDLPSKLAGNDGEVWNVGKLAPGESMVIRSNSALSQAAFTDL